MITLTENLELSDKNTFAICAKCKRWIDFTSKEDLHEIFSQLSDGCQWKVIGGGSNLLFTGDYDGTLLHSAIKGIEVTEAGDGVTVNVRAGSGETLDEMILQLVSQSIWGLENLSGIPGEVGAGAVQNVGAYGVEIKDCIESVEVYDVKTDSFTTIGSDQCGYGYRDSIFKHHDAKERYIVTAVNFIMSRTPSPKLSYGSLDKIVTVATPTPLEVRDAVMATRRAKLPEVGETGSAGSYFKNPVVSREAFERVCLIAGKDANVPHFIVDGGIKIPAAWLIDNCGWKGYKSGNVGVWHKQPLILVNLTGHATPDEVIALERDIISSVKQKFNITLSPEVEKV